MSSTNAGASPLAGAQCNELYFSTSWNNDQSPEAMGQFLQNSGVNDIYILAPNYQAGRDALHQFAIELLRMQMVPRHLHAGRPDIAGERHPLSADRRPARDAHHGGAGEGAGDGR